MKDKSANISALWRTVEEHWEFSPPPPMLLLIEAPRKKRNKQQENIQTDEKLCTLKDNQNWDLLTKIYFP